MLLKMPNVSLRAESDPGESMSVTATSVSQPLHTEGSNELNLKNELNRNTDPELNKYRINPIYLNIFLLNTFLNTPDSLTRIVMR